MKKLVPFIAVLVALTQAEAQSGFTEDFNTPLQQHFVYGSTSRLISSRCK